MAETGDILLFKTNHPLTRITRTYTRSDFDHVGVIFNADNVIQDNGIFVFDACAGQGVECNGWQSQRYFIGENQFRIRCVYRKVNFNRTQECLEKAYRFITEAQGKKFKFTIKKFLAKGPEARLSELCENEFIEENRDFYCSELVAKFFQVIGVLQDQDMRAATQYTPHNFSVKGQSFLNLADGVTIGQEQQCLMASHEEYHSVDFYNSFNN